MKVYLVNDAFRWSVSVVHYGCKAIMDSLQQRIVAAGHQIVAVQPRPLGPVREHLERCDIVIINGEGTFRDEAKNFEPGRHDRMYEGMRLAKRMGKRVYLVNAVWCRMGIRWKRVLQSLDGISTREPASAEAIRRLSGITPQIHPDESYFLTIPVSPDPLPVAKEYVGDFYENVPGVNDLCPEFNDMFRLGLMDHTWEAVVGTLMGSTLYYTGQHHGVYAACRARCPFVACRVNTHKLTSLFEWAGVRIPLASTRSEFFRLAKTHHDFDSEYEKLFNFLERQTPWPIPV